MDTNIDVLQTRGLHMAVLIANVQSRGGMIRAEWIQNHLLFCIFYGKHKLFNVDFLV